MKKIFLMLILLGSFLIAEQVKANTQACIYSEPSGKTENIILGISTVTGQVYDVLATKVSYYKIKVTDPSWTNVEKIGYATPEKISNNVIFGGGLTFRREPVRKEGNEIGYLKNGITIEIIEPVISWYQIQQGWIAGTRGDIVKQ